MSRCPRCHGQNDERAVRCARCGAPLRLAEEPEPRPLDRTLDLDRRLPGPPPSRLPPPGPRREPAAPGAAPPRSRTGAAATVAVRPRPPPAVPAAGRPPPAETTPPGLYPDVEVGTIEVHLRRGAAWRRLASWAVDGALLGLVIVPVAWLVVAAAGPADGAGPAGVDGLVALATRLERLLLALLIFAALASAVYSALSLALMGATPGKMLLGLKVVARDGRRPSPRRAAARSALSLFSASLLGLGCLLALFSRSGRALHDFLAGTYVVER